jgi:hypothetical protein
MTDAGAIRFTVEQSIVGRLTDVAIVAEEESPFDALVEAVVADISIDVEVEVSGVRMHLAAWQDPDHWAEDWREVAGDADVAEFIGGLLARASEVPS